VSRCALPKSTPGPRTSSPSNTLLAQCILNTVVVSQALGCYGARKKIAEKAGEWSDTEFRSNFEAARTGLLDNNVVKMIQERPDILRPQYERCDLAPAQAADIDWDEQNDIILAIARHWGINADLFEYLFTVPASGRKGKGFFYPFYHLSKAWAKWFGWDWHHIPAVSMTKYRRLRTQCNRHAEAAGFGEKGLTPLQLLHWWAHEVSRGTEGSRVDAGTGRAQLA
jgi:hypothetical protein